MASNDEYAKALAYNAATTASRINPHFVVLSTRWAIAEAVVEELRKAGLLRGED
jgi:hypothetical protein